MLLRVSGDAAFKVAHFFSEDFKMRKVYLYLFACVAVCVAASVIV